MISGRTLRRRGRAGAALIATAVVFALAGPVPLAAAAPSAGPPASDPANLVDTFVGTGSASADTGSIDTFPGADVPFGMVQWSPDTSPNRVQGGGYTDTDTATSGFSLTHLSGAGCTIFGDVPILPTTGAVTGNPETATEPFSHSTEHASPGRYQVSVGSPATGVDLSVTTRSGIGTFTFPKTSAANLLFKVSGSESGIHQASIKTVGDREIEGSVESGYFCTTLEHYTLHFVAEFNRPFSAHGTWKGTHVSEGSSSCAGTFNAICGGWVTFDAEKDPTVTMKVGVSYVSTANAALNLHAEDPGWSVTKVASAATDEWNSMLGRIAVDGGTTTDRRTFYTALYHSLLDPATFSDVNGQYEGFDGKVHDGGGQVQYSDFSEWDIYRSEVPLLAMIDPTAASSMMGSLVNDAGQGGWLPVFAVADADAGVMNGDSADAIIADAYAFGARGFDAKEALTYMLKGADTPGVNANQVSERPNLAPYKKLGYVPRNDVLANSVGEPVGASETLEYSIDDFTIAQMAHELGDDVESTVMMERAQNWQNLFDPATGYVGAKAANGSFPAGPAITNPSSLEMLDGKFQDGYAEGNAVQYTWSVPQDLKDLFALIGGDGAATADLEKFFTQLNAGPWSPYDWSGNEPDLFVPWEFDASGAPWEAQSAVRSILTSQYSLTPAGEPGNDDLGAMSSWYVWAALGLYPLTPGTANLAVASPLFPEATIHLGDKKTLRIDAQNTPDTYVGSATLATGSGAAKPLDQAWLPAAVVHSGGTVDFTLTTSPNESWGTKEPVPSYTKGAAAAVGFTEPNGEVKATEPTSVTLGAQSDSNGAVTVEWSVVPTKHVTVTPSSGSLSLPAETPTGTYGRATTTVQVTARSSGTHLVHVDLNAVDRGGRMPPVVLQVKT